MSLGTMNVHTDHFFGPSTDKYIISRGSPGKFDPGPAPSFWFKNLCSANTREALMSNSLTVYATNDNHKFRIVTSGGQYEVGRGDIGPCPQVEYLSRNFLRWKAAGESPENAIAYSKSRKFKEFVVARHERPASSIADSNVGKYVTDVYYDGPINEFGINLSRAATLRQQRGIYEASTVGKELASLKWRGEEIRYFGVTSKKWAVYSIGRLKNGSIGLFIGRDSIQQLSKWADFYNVSLEDMINAAHGEEAMHLYRNSFDKSLSRISDRVEEEAVTKLELYQFYLRLAEGAEGNEALKQNYLRIARHIMHDLETVDRYRKHYTSKNKANIENLTNDLIEEAHAQGLETAEEVSEYVSNRLSEIASETGESVLEEAVNEDSEISEEGIEDGDDSGSEEAANDDNEAANGNEAEQSDSEPETESAAGEASE